MFSKNITGKSPIQKLSSAAEKLIAKDKYTLYGYFSDKACTKAYDFSIYTHMELIPPNADIYAQLYKEFPNYFNKIEYIKPPKNAEEKPEEDTSDLYINKLGYEFATDDEAARSQIRARKDEIIEEAIVNYEKNTSDKDVYLKYIEGNYVRIASPDNLKTAGKYGFKGLDTVGKPIDGYIIENDIDFEGAQMEVVESFSGKIYGNGYKFKNIKINVSSRKLDTDTSKAVGMFKSLDGAYIENVIFENMAINLSVKSGIPVTVGALAVKASNTTLKNVSFEGLTINTGKGDDGVAKYKVYDLIASQRNSLLENVTGSNVKISASEFAQISSVFMPATEVQQPPETAKP